MSYKIYAIKSRNSDLFYVGTTRKEYVLDSYNKHKTEFNAYETMNRNEFYNSQYNYRKSFTVFNKGDTYFVILKTGIELRHLKDELRKYKIADNCVNSLKKYP